MANIAPAPAIKPLITKSPVCTPGLSGSTGCGSGGSGCGGSGGSGGSGGTGGSGGHGGHGGSGGSGGSGSSLFMPKVIVMGLVKALFPSSVS